MNPTAIFASIAFEARTLAHKAHLKSKNYSKHIALQEFYDGIVPLTDKLVEVYQGENSVIEEYPDSGDLTLPKEPVALISVVKNWCENNSKAIAPSEALQNILQEVIALCSQTLYKLQNLE